MTQSKRKSLHRWSLLLVLPLVSVCASIPFEDELAEHGPALPNIVVVLADDMGSGDPRCCAPESLVPTPHLDRLAQEGMRLSDAHSPSAVCTPTRYGLLTGRYAWRTRLKSGVLVGTSRMLLEEGRQTIGSLLGRRGYRTACIGKWHLGLGADEPTDYSRPLRPGPLDFGFDSFFGIPASLDMQPYVYVRDDRPEELPTEEVEASAQRRHGGDGFWRAGPIAPSFRHEDVLQRCADEAVSTIASLAGESEPFFLYLALSAPHTPWLPTADYLGLSGAGHYGDFAAQVDGVVGQVLGALDAAGVAEDTLLLFTSDNGAHWTANDIETFGHRANGSLRGQKADIHEGGHRVPFLVRWAGHVPAGSVRDELACLTDLYATFAAIVGEPLVAEEAEDSVDLSPVLFGRDLEEPPRTSLVHHAFDGTFAVRSGRWKLIEGLGSGGFTPPKRGEPEPGGPTGQLFDLHSDPGEQNDLFEARPEIVRELAVLLEAIRTSGDG